ncbi:uncharacterized protein TRIADDRAFT_58133 [Trichoplax adhaerens]|uniref:proline--tRNA ligase n=1 Tax=Trichoplax adhaerens TaxID=10228 RepID=B3S0Y8_TRIAD|nr:hypothetical protein TRIADDRAFT_58133 [Trichoplax adhaerens]EDV23144.1 hypothetical protein TRIADDRAFT_58133 [Trichoplax adhaerens]|eukprot:XP_002114054.1 hypothetical protein TRIADDRAFT_58133 [Trichoplax adhaerens]
MWTKCHRFNGLLTVLPRWDKPLLYRYYGRQTVSSLFIPMMRTSDQSASASVSRKTILENAGLLKQSRPGLYYILPVALRAMYKLIKVVDEEMTRIGGSKLGTPCLIPADLWQSSGRWDTLGAEMFKLKDRHNRHYCLGPTHEESISELVGTYLNSKNMMPLRLYQIDRKFRDEIRPRLGLRRAREFWMKDMYSFDIDKEASLNSYEIICEAYVRIFNRLGLNVVKVVADSGAMGGDTSHEFHLIADDGEDEILICDQCHKAMNMETLKSGDVMAECNLCEGKQNKNIQKYRGVEIGHAFYLGTKYSKAASVTYTDENNCKVYVEMGSYGIGVTRLLDAALEVQSTCNKIRWPSVITPYNICIVPLGSPKDNSSQQLLQLAQQLYDKLAVGKLQNEVVIDDRIYLSKTVGPGTRLRQATLLGYPYLIILGKQALQKQGYIELEDQLNGSKQNIHIDNIVDHIQQVYEKRDICTL